MNEQEVLKLHGHSPFDVVFRPKGSLERSNARNRKVALPIFVLILVIQIVRFARDTNALASILITTALVIIVFALLWLWSKSRSIVVTSTELQIRLTFRTTVVPLRDIQRVVEQRLVSVAGYGITTEDVALLALNANGQCIGRVNATVFGEDAIQRLATALGKPVETQDDAITSEQCRLRFPGSYTWWVTHPAALGLTLSVVIAAVVVAVVVLIAVLAGS